MTGVPASTHQQWASYHDRCRPGIRLHSVPRPTSPRTGDQAVPAGQFGASQPAEAP